MKLTQSGISIAK